MMRRSVVLGLLAWLGVVAVASALTWTVINAAGQQVLSETSSLPVPGATADPTTGSPSATHSHQHGHRRHRPSDSPSASPPVLTATAVPTENTPREPSPSPGPLGSSSPRTDTQPDGGYQQRTWQGSAGSVGVRCTGSSASLQSATPSDGYQVQVGSRGPGEVEVTFKGGGSGPQVQVQSTCTGGVPRFHTESDARDD